MVCALAIVTLAVHGFHGSRLETPCSPKQPFLHMRGLVVHHTYFLQSAAQPVQQLLATMVIGLESEIRHSHSYATLLIMSL